MRKHPSTRLKSVGHVCGGVSLVLLLVLIVDTYFRSAPLPHINGMTFILCYASALTLSLVASLQASRWWWIESTVLIAITLLIWIGESLLENRL